MCGASEFVAASLVMPLDCLALLTTGACIHGPHKAVANGKIVLAQALLRNNRQTLPQPYFLKEAYMIDLERQSEEQAHIY